ncbi:DUF3500 domain-containing protein [Nocardioides sp. KR10-350]|uniref:DUF3500 domain-containing protein n=1 Tax=Nocardioides cheoyonin TaxID=3156615 RepID=UPI0032B4183D
MTREHADHRDDHPHAHGHRHHEPGSPGFVARRRFITQAFAAAGVAAFSGMLAACGSSGSSTSLTSSSEAPSGYGGPGGEGPGGGGPGGGGPGGGGGADGGPGITDKFVGVTTDGTVIEDLFSIHRTGVSTRPVVAAAKAWLGSLTAAQRKAVTFPVSAADYTKDQWRLWTNVDGDRSDGMSLQDMTSTQRAKAMAILKAGMSARGLENADKVRHLNLYGGQLTDTTDRFNDELYWLVIMGRPSMTEPWGFQFEGHHLVINYFVLGDQVVMTPTFMGSEPTIAKYKIDSKYEGTRIFTEELAAGYDVVRSLDEDQQSVAIVQGTPSDLSAGAYSDNKVLPYEGIKATDLSGSQLAKLWKLVELYVGNVDEGHARVKMAEVRKHKDETHFSWHGTTEDDAPIYYRVHSPVVLIELDCQDLGPVGEAAGWDAGMSQRHIHTIIRTPNGNDYGKSLLALHLELDH